MRIELHIERLVVEGLPLADGDASRLREAVEAELTRALLGADPTAFAASAEAGRRTSVSLPRDPRPRDVGTGIGAALGRAIIGQAVR